MHVIPCCSAYAPPWDQIQEDERLKRELDELARKLVDSQGPLDTESARILTDSLWYLYITEDWDAESIRWLTGELRFTHG